MSAPLVASYGNEVRRYQLFSLLDAAQGLGLAMSDVVQEAGNGGGPEVARVPLVVEKAVAAGLVGVAFGDGRRMPGLAEARLRDLTGEVEEPRRLGRGLRRAAGGVDRE